MSLPRYERYKESGVEWLGEVPEGWEVLQGRRLFSQKREPSLPEDEQLSATQKYGVVPQKLFMELEDQKVTLALSGLENFKHVEQDDFVISLRSFQGGIERSQYAGCVSPAYTVLRANQPICGAYWAPILKSSEYIAALQSVTDGIRDGKNISYEQFGQIALPIPPLSEQQTIAAFLNRETGKIDALVAEQERLIALLKEKRQATISHAVTKGLNPAAPLKDSGVEWLGEVPEGWEVVPLRWFSTCSSGESVSTERIESDSDDQNSIPVIGGNGIMGFTNQQNINHPILAVGRVGALCGNVHIVYPPAWITDNALILDASSKSFNLSYLAAVLKSRNLNDIAAKTAQPLITGTQVRDQRMPCPPSEEQSAIVAFLNSETAKIDTLAGEARQAISLLKERRSALISAAVTGKIDVRLSDSSDGSDLSESCQTDLSVKENP